MVSWLQTVNVNVAHYGGKDLREKQILRTQSYMISLRKKKSVSKDVFAALYSIL